jgi:hypothetical protein
VGRIARGDRGAATPFAGVEPRRARPPSRPIEAHGRRRRRLDLVILKLRIPPSRASPRAYTTLAETRDRLFAAALTASRRHNAEVDFAPRGVR